MLVGARQSLLDVLEPPVGGSVYLIGGGGKTTSMYRLAAEVEAGDDLHSP